ARWSGSQAVSLGSIGLFKARQPAGPGAGSRARSVESEGGAESAGGAPHPSAPAPSRTNRRKLFTIPSLREPLDFFTRLRSNLRCRLRRKRGGKRLRMKVRPRTGGPHEEAFSFGARGFGVRYRAGDGLR